MAFKAQQVKKGFFDIHGLEDFVERKVHDVMQALGLSGKTPAKAAAPAKKAVTKKAAPAPKAVKVETDDALAVVLSALESNSKKAALIKAGKQKDQLLRALIPLYVAKGNIEVSSGTTTRFWAKHGVSFAAPNVAKALREHVGYARRTAKGPQITPNGTKYVDAALNGTKKKAA